MPRESQNRKNEREERAAVVHTTHERSGWKCQAADLPTGMKCFGDLECDEIVSRARYPGGHLDRSNTQSLCQGHNQWKEDHPAQAKALGLARSWGVMDVD